MPRIRIFYIIFVFLLGVTVAQAQTLREAVQQAITTHPEILLNRAQTSSARQGVAVAQGGYYPQVDINSAYGSEWTESPFTKDLAGQNSTTLARQEFNVALVQNIYSGGAIVNEVDRNIFIFKSQDYKTMSAINDLGLSVAEAYLDVLLQQELVHIAGDSVTEHQRLLKFIDQRTSAGIARIAELDQAESRSSLAEANLLSAQGKHREAMVRYRKLVGCWPEDLVTPYIPSESILPPTVEDAIREGFNHHPIIKSAREDINQAIAQRKIAKAAFLPKLDAVLSASRNRNLDGIPGVNYDNVGLIRVSYNVFKGGGDVGNLKKTTYQVQEAFETRNRSMIELKERIQLDYNTWYANKKRAVALRDYVSSIAKTKAAYFEQFQIGQRSFLDLLNSVTEVNRAKAEFLQSRKDEVSARYRILASVGRLMYFFAKQSDRDRYRIDIFSMPPAKTEAFAKKGTAHSILNSQVIYPTGNMRIAPTVTPQGTQAPLNSYIPTIMSVLPAVPAKSSQIPMPHKIMYLVELSGFENNIEAEDMLNKIVKKGMTAQIKGRGNLERIVVGPFKTISEANKALDLIEHSAKIVGIIRQMTAQDNLKGIGPT